MTTSWGGGSAPSPDDLSGEGPGHALVAEVIEALRALPNEPAVEGAADPRDAAELLALFEAQALSRWLDVAACRLAAAGIAPDLPTSAGHEANAALGMALRAGDPVFAHYRSRALVQARGLKAVGVDAVADAALALRGARDHAGSLGRYPLGVDPRLDVAMMGLGPADHLPRALGAAWSVGRQSQLPARRRARLRWPDDAVVVAGFGDGSVNRASALAALNAVSWATDQGVPLPLLLVCEDNGIAGATRSQPGWVRSVLDGRAGLEYLPADGADPVGMLSAARWAVETVRLRREPVVLHVSCVRLGGHTGPEAEPRLGAHAAATKPQDDPIIATAQALVLRGIADPTTVRQRWDVARARVSGAVREARRRPAPSQALEITGAVAAYRRAEVARGAGAVASLDDRKRTFGGALPEDEGPLTLGDTINRALTDIGLARPGVVMLGPDIARVGGTYGVTAGLQRRLGASRVIDTLADDETVVGLTIGAGTSGLVPIAEPGPLGRFLLTEAQLRSQAAGSWFYTGGVYGAAAVIRVPGLTPAPGATGAPGGTDGWGGFAPDDLALGGLRDVPGLVVACLAHPSDAAGLLRSCVALAEDDGRTCVVIEPSALYHEQDLVNPGDGAWSATYQPPHRWADEFADLGRASVWGDGDQLTIATYGNGVRMALRVASRLGQEGIGVRVVDLRWLSPLPVEDVVREASATGRLLVVDELRRTAGISAALVTGALEAGFTGRIARVGAADAPLPAAPAAALIALNEHAVADAANLLLGR